MTFFTIDTKTTKNTIKNYKQIDKEKSNKHFTWNKGEMSSKYHPLVCKFKTATEKLLNTVIIWSHVYTSMKRESVFSLF